jgi:hypothetical protein
LATEEQMFCLKRMSRASPREAASGSNAGLHFYLSRLFVNYLRPQFQWFHQGFSQGYLAMGLPHFQQTEGLVELFDLVGTTLKHSKTLSSFKSEQAGYFGSPVVLTEIQHDGLSTSNHLLLCASRFASQGRGAVYIYDVYDHELHKDPQWRQTLTCPELTNFSVLDQHQLNYGYTFTASAPGAQWLCVSALPHGQGRVYLYRYEEGFYQWINTLVLPTRLPHQNFGHTCSIDQLGTVLIADQQAVYFCFSGGVWSTA